MQKVFKCMEDALKYLSVFGKYRGKIWQIYNCLRIRGKYLNVLGEYVERIEAYMEETQN
jgi:hypothetical protein